MSVIVNRRQLKNQAKHSSKPVVTHEDNVFTIIGMGHQEIKHSNFLAYIIDPNNKHGLGLGMLKYLYKIAFPDITPSTNIKVIREKEEDMDLLIIDKTNMCLIVIENKVKARLSKTQLDKYYDYTRIAYNKYRRAYMFLTPEGRSVPPAYSSNFREWRPISYMQLAERLFYVSFREKITEGRQKTFVPRDGMKPLTSFLILSWLQLLEQEKVIEVTASMHMALQSLVSFTDVTDLTVRVAELEAANELLKRKYQDSRDYLIKLKNHGIADGMDIKQNYQFENRLLKARLEESRMAYERLLDVLKSCAARNPAVASREVEQS